jgi:ribosome biogenesis protein Nip4
MVITCLNQVYNSLYINRYILYIIIFLFNIYYTSGLGRITDDTPQYQGVIVYSMSDLPLGFGVSAKSTAECRHADPMATIAFHQADIGEYLRSEENLI